MTTGRLSAWLRSPAWQVVGVVLAVMVVAALNRQSDGLWFQGDAPRHAINGLFWWDLLKAWPRDPVDFAVRYYARYPVIAPATYPPLFYLVEGLAFTVVGPTPYVARLVVLLCAVAAGLYSMAWARRWLDPLAGWAGAFLAFTPGMVLWSNAVMLNIPATAAGLASLYHFRRWLETAQRDQLALTVLPVAAGLLTYYPSASVVPVLAAWGVWHMRGLRLDRKSLWIAVAGLVAMIPLLAALRLAPVHTSRHLPTLAFLSTPSTWTYYWHVLPSVIGGPALALGLAGGAAGVVSRRWRANAIYLVIWIAVLIAGLSLLPARDPRYVLLAAPAFVLAGAIGAIAVVQSPARLHPAWHAAMLTVGIGAGLWSAAGIRVPHVSGFRELAAYLRDTAPADAVLYDGDYDGAFGFYVRALDPMYERRMVLADKFIYQYGPSTTFVQVQRLNARTAEDVVRLLHLRCGCRWVAIEVSRRSNLPVRQRLLREAVKGPDFELVRSFPIAGAGERRVDLYRVVGTVAPVDTVDLTFPSYSERAFLRVAPITR